MTVKYNYIASPGGLQELSESLREGGEPNADSCAEGPLPLSPRPAVLTFDYRQRLSLRKYQDCGTSPAQSVSKKNKNTGIISVLKIVNLLGKFIIYFSYHIIFSTLGNFNINKVSCHQFFWRIYKNTSIYLWCIHIRTSNVDIIFK